MTELKPVAEAQEAIFSMMGRAPGETIALEAADGRILAEDISALIPHPAADISAMDGYAVQSGGAALSAGKKFQITGESAAGHIAATAIEQDQAMRIFTGAYLPEGADAIALQEDARKEGNYIILQESVKPGQFVRPKGLDFNEGEVILSSGTPLGARHLALAGLAGHTKLPVRKKPVVAILSSGDELVEVGTPPKIGQLINSNSVFLRHALKQTGAEVIYLGIIEDRARALISALEAGLDRYGQLDLVICTGGASVGKHDHIASDLMADSAAEMNFWRIAMRPGKPLIAASWRNIPFLGLPGNPVSAGVCSLIFALPAIRIFLGLPALPETRLMPLAEDMPENDRRQDYIRAQYVYNSHGQLCVKPFGKQDSSLLRNFCHAELLIVRPPHAKAALAGANVRVMDIPTSL